MKNIIYYGFVYSLLFINNTVISQFNPCYDDLYLELKARGLNAMTTREYHYFTRKDEECSEYNTFDKQYHDQLNSMQNEIFRIADRLSELDEELLWKWWSKDEIDMQNIRVELIDILHFLISAMMCAGLTAEKVFDIYQQKHAVNIKRQDMDYNKKIKTEDDNKDIH